MEISRKKKWEIMTRGMRNNWNFFRKNKLGMAGIVILIFFFIVAFLSPIPPLIDEMYVPLTGVDENIIGFSSPSLKHPLGTDYVGRDLMSQLMHGTVIALMVGITAAFMSVVIGTVAGLVSGYYGKTIDMFISRFEDIILTLPSLPLLIIVASAVGKMSVWNIVIFIGALGWAGTGKVIRSQVLSLRERPYVESARISGASDARIIFRHIAPNILPLSFLYMTFGVTGAILTEASLSFIGLGDPNNVSWGMMLQWCFTTGHTFSAPFWLLPPGICITLLTMSFYFIGRAMDEIINPRTRER
jgi:peptide/nickel transport system permease protein